ncbi:MAG: hypothetical protein GEU83_17355 [Pseudonocardiaceae bacterium]|nr:hypothetical protein [Pseudonocardiaceae bacterium]
MVDAGHRLIDFLERVDSNEPPFAAPPGDSDRAGFLLAFTDAIAGTGSGIVDGAVRRAAVRAAAMLVERCPQLPSGVPDPAGSSPGAVGDELVNIQPLISA